MLKSYNLIYVICIVICLSCGEKSREESEVTSADLIVQALNKSNYERAFELIEKEDNTDPEVKYWKSQAHSIKAGVDIYSLFPIMKMKLFDVAMSEWGAMDKYSERSESRVTGTLLGEGGKESIDELKEILDITIATPLDKLEYKVESFEDSKQTYPVYNTEGTDETSFYCIRKYKLESDTLYLKRGSEEVSTTTVAYLYEFENLDIDKTSCKAMLDYKESKSDEDFRNQLKFGSIWLLNKAIDNITKKKESERIIKASFALFDSIPIIKQVPDLHVQNVQSVSDSLKLLKEIKDVKDENTRLGRNTRQHMGLLSGFLIMGSLKDSIDLDKVNEPFDIACQTKPKVLIEHYPHFKEGVIYLLESVEGTEFSKKNSENLDKMKERINDLPESLTEEQKEEYIDDIEDFIEDNC